MSASIYLVGPADKWLVVERKKEALKDLYRDIISRDNVFETIKKLTNRNEEGYILLVRQLLKDFVAQKYNFDLFTSLHISEVEFLIQPDTVELNPVSRTYRFPNGKAFLEEYHSLLERAVFIDANHKKGEIISDGEDKSYVLKGILRGQPVAVRMFLCAANAYQYWKLEAGVLSVLEHPNIVKIKGVCVSDEDDPESHNPCLVMELLDYSLDQFLKEYVPTIEDIFKIANDMAEAMSFLHTYDMIHGNLKAKFFMIKVDEDRRPITVKLADFGINSANKQRKARLPSTRKSSVEHKSVSDASDLFEAFEAGSPPASAPASSFNIPNAAPVIYDKTVDIFEYGQILLEVVKEAGHALTTLPTQFADIIRECSNPTQYKKLNFKIILEKLKKASEFIVPKDKKAETIRLLVKQALSDGELNLGEKFTLKNYLSTMSIEDLADTHKIAHTKFKKDFRSRFMGILFSYKIALLELSKYKLDFGLSQSEQKQCQKFKKLTDKITLFNLGKTRLVISFPVSDGFEKEKYYLNFFPCTCKIEPGASIQVDIELVFLEVTELREVIEIHVDCSMCHYVKLELASCEIPAKFKEIDYDEIKMGENIGHGGTASVQKVLWNNQLVAVKKFNIHPEYAQFFAREVKIMSMLDHPNVVPFYGACIKYPNLCIVMKFMPQGSLRDLL
jgi:serine/threonine protein kinase